MPVKADDIITRYNSLYSLRAEWESVWQTCADYLLPRLGQFNKKNWRIFDSTAPIALGRFAAAMESFLTPRTQIWHTLVTGDPILDQRHEVRKYLEAVNAALFEARYRPEANFGNQMQEAFLSLGVHGLAVILIEDDLGRGLRYTCIPAHEVYLAANAAGRIDTVYRLYKLTARQALAEFGEDCPEKIRQDAGNEQHMDKEYEFIHAVFPRGDCDLKKKGPVNMPIVSVHVARQFKTVVRESGFRTMPYAVSRFSVAPGDVYGRSPAMDVMPDIVQLNAMKKTVLRAAEKMVNPPLLTPEEDIIAAYNLKAGAINPGGVNAEGRQMVFPLQINGNVPIGLEMMEQNRQVINDAFFITLFQVLVESSNQTATEVVQRAQEKAQLLAPAVSRQQSELLRTIITRELDIIIHGGGLEFIEVPEILLDRGGPQVMPKYDTAMGRTLESGKGISILQAVEGLAALANLDPAVMAVIDPIPAARVVCESMGVPAASMRSDKEVQKIQQEQQQQAEMAQAMQLGQAAIQGLDSASNAEKNLREAQMMSQGMPDTLPS